MQEDFVGSQFPIYNLRAFAPNWCPENLVQPCNNPVWNLFEIIAQNMELTSLPEFLGVACIRTLWRVDIDDKSTFGSQTTTSLENRSLLRPYTYQGSSGMASDKALFLKFPRLGIAQIMFSVMINNMAQNTLNFYVRLSRNEPHGFWSHLNDFNTMCLKKS